MVKFAIDFPALSRESSGGKITTRFSTDTQVNESLISNVSIIPTIGDQYVMIRLDNGKWELAGGTLEPGEHYLDGLRREVLEELGAELINYEIFGHFYCVSSADKPYRPHIPHPNFVRLVGMGEVRIISKPLNPPDGEKVIAVEQVHIDEALRRFESISRSDIAELYKYAHFIRENKGMISFE